jgi:hypothetical protein
LLLLVLFLQKKLGELIWSSRKALEDYTAGSGLGGVNHICHHHISDHKGATNTTISITISTNMPWPSQYHPLCCQHPAVGTVAREL